MAGARLQRAAILHHGFHGVGAQRARELFLLGLDSLDYRHGHFLLDEIGVHVVQDHQGFALGILFVHVDGMAFLPQEFGGAQEWPRAQLPPHHVGPLIDQQRQVAPRANPLGVEVSDDRLRSRADHIRLRQFFAAGARDLCDLRCEALHVLGFLH